MNDDPIDFSPLDPTADEERFERMVHAIGVRSAGFFVARRRASGVMAQIASWRAPMLAAAAAVVIASVLVLAHTSLTPTAAPAPRTPQIAEAVGVPSAVAQWMRSGDVPTTVDLITTFGDQP